MRPVLPNVFFYVNLAMELNYRSDFCCCQPISVHHVLRGTKPGNSEKNGRVSDKYPNYCMVSCCCKWSKAVYLLEPVIRMAGWAAVSL